MPYDSEFSKLLLNILQNMVSITAKSTYFKELLFSFFKIFYTLIVHYVINFVFSKLKRNYIVAINFVSYIHVVSGVSRISFRGGSKFFWKSWKSCSAWQNHAFTRGFGGMLPRENFKSGAIWCVLESILLKFCQKNNFKNSHFFI